MTEKPTHTVERASLTYVMGDDAEMAPYTYLPRRKRPRQVQPRRVSVTLLGGPFVLTVVLADANGDQATAYTCSVPDGDRFVNAFNQYAPTWAEDLALDAARLLQWAPRQGAALRALARRIHARRSQ